MREIMFKELTAGNLRKKDTVLREVFEKDGVVAKTERRCFYFIKDVMQAPDVEGLQKWLNEQNKEGTQEKRHFHIMKEHNDSAGEDKVICKITGTFYAVFNNTVYSIGFLHAFKVCFMRATLAQ
jgi:ribosomal 50S subunit-associated protein YjgA (DUF615 family)